MRPPVGRPIGIALVAIAIAVNGIASLADAVALVGPTVGAVIAAIVSAVIGLFLLFRSYGIWELKYRAWLMTLLLLCLRGIITSVRLLLGPSDVLVWVDAAVIIVTIVYMLHPRVRHLFSGQHDPLMFK